MLFRFCGGTTVDDGDIVCFGAAGARPHFWDRRCSAGGDPFVYSNLRYATSGNLRSVVDQRPHERHCCTSEER
jgi:hypothetical protein